MQEKDLYRANQMLENKKNLLWAANGFKQADTIDLIIKNQHIRFRATALKDFMVKEIDYIERTLKSLGVTELS